MGAVVAAKKVFSKITSSTKSAPTPAAPAPVAATPVKPSEIDSREAKLARRSGVSARARSSSTLLGDPSGQLGNFTKKLLGQ